MSPLRALGLAEPQAPESPVLLRLMGVAGLDFGPRSDPSRLSSLLRDPSAMLAAPAPSHASHQLQRHCGQCFG